MNFTILRFDSIDSTNTEALKHARQGADEGLCVVARQQTAGRGRQGRVWSSRPDEGLYFSVVLRPKLDPQFLPLVTLMSGVAVYEMLAELGLDPDIKWVNDVLVEEKKICGILAETTETEIGLALVVGIGINLTSGTFPPEIAETATSVSAELGRDIKIAEVEAALARFFGYWYDMLLGPGGPAEIVNAWRKRSSYFSGKRVRAQVANGPVAGVTDGLEPNGALRVIADDGALHIVQTGDIERLRAVEPSV